MTELDKLPAAEALAEIEMLAKDAYDAGPPVEVERIDDGDVRQEGQDDGGWRLVATAGTPMVIAEEVYCAEGIARVLTAAPALIRLARRALAPPTTDTARVRELASRESCTMEENEGVACESGSELRRAALSLASAHDALAARVAEAARAGEDRVLDLVREEWDDDYNADGLIHHVRARLGRKP